MTPLQSLAIAAGFGFVITAVLDAAVRGRIQGRARWLRALIPLVALAALILATWGRTGIAPLRGLVSAVALGSASALLVFPTAAPVGFRAVTALLAIGSVAVLYSAVGLPPAWARFRADTVAGCLVGIDAVLPNTPRVARVAYCRCTTAPVLDGCWRVDLPWRFRSTEDCVVRRFERIQTARDDDAVRDRCATLHLGEGARALYDAHARGLLAAGVEAAVKEGAQRGDPGAAVPERIQREFLRCYLGALLDACPDKTFVGYRHCSNASDFPGMEAAHRTCTAAAFAAR